MLQSHTQRVSKLVQNQVTTPLQSKYFTDRAEKTTSTPHLKDKLGSMKYKRAKEKLFQQEKGSE